MLKRILRFLTTGANNRLDPERVSVSRKLPKILWGAFAMLLFADVFSRVRAQKTTDVDVKITHTVQTEGAKHPWFDRLMHIVSWPGFPPQSRIIPPSLAAALWLKGYRLEAVFQLAAWGTGGVSSIFKRIVKRERPGPKYPHLRVTKANIGGTSFPSGHVIIYTGVYGFAAYLAALWIETKSVRRVVVGGLIGLVGLVGVSRVYLGHHWATDTLASYLLGTTYLVVLTSLYRRAKRMSLVPWRRSGI
ncbi:MAG: phosphatase PAP2 family protein [Thermomicrobiales bacterium]|nr:phosphatase PAP2 family protein [Thermomicrobiales bacterium]